MKTSRNALVVACAAALVFGLLMETAWAGTIIDKGDLGKYERKGRLVFRVLTPPPRNTEITPAPEYRPDGKVVMARGSTAQWERHGRLLKRVLDGHVTNATVATSPAFEGYRTVNHIKHRHRYPS